MFSTNIYSISWRSSSLCFYSLLLFHFIAAFIYTQKMWILQRQGQTVDPEPGTLCHAEVCYKYRLLHKGCHRHNPYGIASMANSAPINISFSQSIFLQVFQHNPFPVDYHSFSEQDFLTSFLHAIIVNSCSLKLQLCHPQCVISRQFFCFVSERYI